ncbi:MAG: hypothetical protein HC788_00425 [Sphingopyxis sp.]|nr:hypothetical protein [Sphingopyxis sp.]
MLFAAALLFTTAPLPPLATAAAPSATAIGTARARILRPVQVTRLGDTVAAGSEQRQTHRSQRKDGAAVVDCY